MSVCVLELPCKGILSLTPTQPPSPLEGEGEGGVNQVSIFEGQRNLIQIPPLCNCRRLD
jgi:hypothetical protein